MGSIRLALSRFPGRKIDHFVQFYKDDDYLRDQVSAFVRAGLRAGDAVVVIASKPLRDELEKRVRGDLASAAERYRVAELYVALDADETLEKFMLGAEPDEARFADFVGPILARAADGGQRRLRVFGEMVNLLSTNGAHEAALRLEQFWGNLAKVHPMSIFCAYSINAFSREADGEAFRSVCNAHSRVSPAETYTPPANAHEHYRAIALLQQKAVALETEMARTKELEKALETRA